MRRTLFAAAAVAATLLPGTGHAAGCTVDEIASGHPFECTPPPPGGESFLLVVSGCGYTVDPTTLLGPPSGYHGWVTVDPYVVPFAVRIRTQCVFADGTSVEQTTEGPVGHLGPARVPASVAAHQICFRTDWWFSDGTGGAKHDC